MLAPRRAQSARSLVAEPDQPRVTRIETSRTVKFPPVVVFEEVSDFEAYPAHTPHLESVSRAGDGDVGTEYELRVAALGLSADVRTRLTAVDPPREISWTLLGDLTATGSIEITAIENRAGSRIDVWIDYDPESLDSNAISLPFGLSVEWVRSKAEALAKREMERVLDGLLADLEASGDGSR
ncbi:MAG: SRPBCC family protein [Halodesulfurarchaeum sp.]